MNVTRVKEITTDNGYISANYPETNSITFFADIPKNAVVDTVKVDGAFIEDIGRNKTVEIYRQLTSGTKREIATVYYNGKIPQELFDKINSYQVQNFEVYYHEEAVIKE
jgi:hypothetical protein